MNVEAYRKVIRRRMIAMLAISAFYVAAMVAMHTVWRVELGLTASFLEGFASAVVGLTVVLAPRYRRALKDEQALRRMWNREHDERMSAIRARAGLPMLMYTSLAMITAALLLSAWNVTVAATLLLAATAQLLIGVVTKLVCTRVM